jgi:hypothetical protein
MPGNPFHFSRPVRPGQFLGRGFVVSKIADDLYDLYGDSYGVVGGRRFGKSSLLLVLQDELVRKLEQAESGDWQVLPVFVSLKAREPISPTDVLGLALHKIRRATGGVRKPAPLSSGPLLDLGMPEYTEITAPPANLQELEAAVEDIVLAAYQKVGMLRIALLIDEVDCALDFPWTGALFGMLRSLIYDGPVCDHVRLVLAGSGRYLDVGEKGSPLLNAIKPCFLESFTEDAVRELVDRAHNIPTAVADEVMQQGAGHPFILQHLLHYLVEGGIRSATNEAVNAEVRRFVHDRSADLEGWWYAIGEEGRRVYCILAQSADWMTHADLIQAANDQNFQPDRGLKALCYHGLIVHDGTYQKFHISGQLFQDWSLARCPALKKELGSQEHKISGQVTQVAGANALQFGQVSGGTIIIQRETSFQPLVEVDPEKATRLGPIAEMLKTRFDREEFRALCFNIGVNYDSLSPGGLEAQAIQLVLSCDRAGRLETLIAEIRRLRPHSIP